MINYVATVEKCCYSVENYKRICRTRFGPEYGTSGKEPASAGEIRDTRLTLGSARPPGRGHGDPPQGSCWRIPWTEEPGGLEPMGHTRQTRLKRRSTLPAPEALGSQRGENTALRTCPPWTRGCRSEQSNSDREEKCRLSHTGGL